MVTSFAAQETLLSRLDSVISKLTKALDAKRVMPRGLPTNAPAEIPRALLIAQNTFIQIALNRIEVRITPPEHVAGSIDSAGKYFSDVLNGVLCDLFTSAPRPQWVGAILTTQYRSSSASSAIEAVRPIFRRLVTVSDPGPDLSAFNFMFGVKNRGFFRHVTIQGYQTTELVAEMRQGALDIPVDQATVTEAGVQLILDVNNKPSATKTTSIAELLSVLEDLQLFSKNALTDLGLNDLLNNEH